MPDGRRTLLRSLATLVAVLVASVLVGLGVGYVLSVLSGEDGGDPVPVAGPATASRPAEPDAPPSTPPAGAAEPDIRVLASTLAPATTPSGRERRRARVVVRVRVTAADDPFTLGAATLSAGGEEIEADPNADEALGDLADPVPAGDTASGELRFETAGALTDALTADREGTLRLGARSFPLELTTP